MRDPGLPGCRRNVITMAFLVRMQHTCNMMGSASLDSVKET
jgi:hypothetical protein